MRIARLGGTGDLGAGLVFGRSETAVERVRSLAEQIEGLGTLSAGPLENAASVEAHAAFANARRKNDGKEFGLQIR